jgi:hypothetical protein
MLHRMGFLTTTIVHYLSAVEGVRQTTDITIVFSMLWLVDCGVWIATSCRRLGLGMDILVVKNPILCSI